MKLALLLILAILPMVIIPAFAEDYIIVTIDKSEYNHGDTVYINGTVDPNQYDYSTSLTLIIVSPNNNITTIEQFEVPVDGLFNIEIETGKSQFSLDGTYTIKLQYGSDKIDIYFDLLPNNIQLQNNSEYYKTEIITLNGTITEIDWSIPTTITYDIYHDSVIETSDGGILNNDGTFDFTIDTVQWDYDGEVKVTVNIQNYTSSIYFDYYNIPNTTNEVLHERILDNDSDILQLDEKTIIHESAMAEHDYHLINQNNTIIAHDAMLNEHNTMMYEYEDKIITLNNTNILQQLELDTLRNDLTITAGFLSNLNVTLSVSVPPVLSESALAEILNENSRHQNEIDQLNSKIISTQASLDQAIQQGNTSKIEKYEKSIASYELSRAHSQSKLNMSNLLLLVYPQE